MRDPHVIASEIDRARHDLDESLGALKALVRDKLDVRQRVRGAIERGLQRIREVVQRLRARARQHQGIAALTVCAVAALVYVWISRRRR